jgi:hypothetical protein
MTVRSRLRLALAWTLFTPSGYLSSCLNSTCALSCDGCSTSPKSDSDYTIFAWRQQQEHEVTQDAESVASTSRVTLPPSAHPHPHPQSQSKEHTPTLHLHNPSDVLPQPPTYCNPSYYIFREAAALRSAQQRPTGAGKSGGKGAKGRKHKKPQQEEEDGVIPLKRDFEKFHSQNGVRTIMGSIGPVENGAFSFLPSQTYGQS